MANAFAALGMLVGFMFCLFMVMYAPSFNSTLLGINMTTASAEELNAWQIMWIVGLFATLVGMALAIFKGD